MTPVVRIGPWCSRCGERAALDGDLCRPCNRLLTAFGHTPELTSVDDPRFDVELDRWREAS